MLSKKNIVIIGGTSGIGLAAAKACAKAGAKLSIMGLDDSSCEIAQNELGSSAQVLQGDAREELYIQAVIDRCRETFGAVDALFHVAGGSGRKQGDGPLDTLSISGWNYTLELNLTSIMLSNRAAVRAFLDQGKGGSILNTASVLAFSPSPEYFTTHAYAAAKSAIIGFSKAIAAHYVKKDIRVNVLAPGLVHTPMAQRAAQNEEIMTFVKEKQPLDGGRIGFPEDLLGAILFCLSDQSRFMTGQVIAVDGGWSVSEGRKPFA